MSNSILTYFLDISMSYGHKRLREIAKKENRPVDKLRKGDFLLFINRRMTALKILTADDILLHKKAEKGSFLDFEAINKLPLYFNSKTGFDYRTAVRESLISKLKRNK